MNFKAAINKVGLKLRQHSPEILGAVGIAATVGGVIWACKATVDCADDIKECQENVADIKQSVEDEIITKKEGTKRIIRVGFNCVKSVSVKYVGPVVLIGGGLFCQYKSKSILNRRLNSAAMAYTALESRYKLLEDNVRRDYGEEELNRLKYGLGSKKGIVKRVDDEGNEVENEETINGVMDVNNVEPFTIIFDSRSNKHHTSTTHCEGEFRAFEQTMTQLLPIKGVIWLDWAMNQLDIHPRSKEEAKLWHLICWKYKPGAPECDNQVKLRFQQVIDPDLTDFENDYNPVYVLDPNYDTNFTQDWYQPRK